MPTGGSSGFPITSRRAVSASGWKMPGIGPSAGTVSGVIPSPSGNVDCGKVECIGGRAELEGKSGVKLRDLHKHFVDDVTYPCSCGRTMRRVSEVLDCWFESGAMPYAQNHYPYEKREHFEAHFPADFISEGLDQTRGWFYTLVILGAALFDKPAFMNVVVNGLVLAEDGKKMSKSERNYSDPADVMENFGADALRLFLMNSAVVRGEDLKYSDQGVKSVLREILIPLWNSYSFFVTYANIDGIRPLGSPKNPENPLDRWILSEMTQMIQDFTEALDHYELQKAIQPILNFIDNLNNWYIRRSRRRFWRSENDLDKEQAYETLHTVLMTLVHAAAPIVPFISEEIYQNLRGKGSPESVHLADFPEANPALRDEELERKMRVTQQAVLHGPGPPISPLPENPPALKALHLVTRDEREKRILREMEEIIREELNVKEVHLRENEEDLVEYKAKANFKVLGRRLGKDMKAAAARIEELSPREIQSILEGNTLYVDLPHLQLELSSESVLVQRFEKENLKVLNEGALTVALDPEITGELKQEGLVRDILRSVQNLRKDRDLDVTDRIRLFLNAGDEVREAVEAFKEYLTSETLAESLEWTVRDDQVTTDCGDERVQIALEKV